MESLNGLRDSLLSSSRPTRQDDEQLTTSFKAAALHLTTLYKTALRSSKSSFAQGYTQGLSDVLELVQARINGVEGGCRDTRMGGAGAAAGLRMGRANEQDGGEEEEESEGRERDQQLRWLVRYLCARLEAIKSDEEDEDAGTGVGSTSASAEAAGPSSSSAHAMRTGSGARQAPARHETFGNEGTRNASREQHAQGRESLQGHLASTSRSATATALRTPSPSSFAAAPSSSPSPQPAVTSTTSTSPAIAPASLTSTPQPSTRSQKASLGSGPSSSPRPSGAEMPSTSGFNFRAPTSTFVSDSVPSSGTGAMGGPAALELVTPFGLGLNGPAAQKRRHHTPPGAVVRAAASGSSAQRARRKARWSAPAPYALEADLADRGGAGAGVGAGADGGAGFSTDGEDEGEMEHSGVDGGEQLERVHHARPAIERERERPRKRRKDGAVNGDGNANGNANAAGSELGGH